MRRVVQAAHGKPILFFPARFDHYRVQTGDGYAAHIAGAIGVSTDAQATWWGGKGIGTVPHGLIAACGGDTVLATRLFADVFHPDINVTALVDFDNDCVATSLAVARELGDRLWGVRLDTAETLVDRSLWPLMGQFRPNGVAPELVREVRRALDAEGFESVRIVVSGGFNPERIAAFEEAGVPADAYGVGSSLLRGIADFTADVVLLEGRPCAKVGRSYRPNPRLERVEVAAAEKPPEAHRSVAAQPPDDDVCLPSMRSTKSWDRRPITDLGSMAAALAHSARASCTRSMEK